MNEKLIERKLREEVKKMGGMAIKFFAVSFTGFPDRIILMPGAHIYFVELKTTGKPLSARQKIVKEFLQKLGFKYFIVDDRTSLDEFLFQIDLDKIITQLQK